MFNAKLAACSAAFTALLVSHHARAADDDVIASPVCSSIAIADAHRAAAPAVVAVFAPGLHGLPTAGIGFVFHSSRHVATALSIVENGRGIEVVIGAERHSAVVVALSRTHDLAILRLERSVAATPLVAARRALPVGEPMLAIGRSSMASDADTVITPGIVTHRSDAHLRSNALAGPQLNYGGPLLDCAGDVVGIATSLYEDQIAPAAALADLAGAIDDDASYESGWSLWHPSLTFLGQIDGSTRAGMPGPDGWLGLSIGTALIGDDRWMIPFDFRALVLTGTDTPNPFEERKGARFQLASGLGYRFMLSGGDLPTYLIPTLGATLSYETIDTRSTELLAQGCGSRQPCGVTIVGSHDVSSLFRVMPTAGLKLQFGFASVGYEMQLDVEAFNRSVHQLGAGFQF